MGEVAGMDGVCMVQVENNFENWKNKSISVYILGMLGPLVEGAVNGMHTDITITSNTIAALEVLKPWHVLVTVDKSGWGCGNGWCVHGSSRK